MLNMELLNNSKGEKLSQESFNYLLESKETIDISFIDGKRVRFPRFLFFFFSNLDSSEDIDSIVLPIIFQEGSFENIIEYLVNPKEISNQPLKEFLKLLGLLTNDNLPHSDSDSNQDKGDGRDGSDEEKDNSKKSFVIVNKAKAKEEVSLSVKLENEDLEEDDCDISVSDIEEFHSMLTQEESNTSCDLKPWKKKSFIEEKLSSKKDKIATFMEEYGNPNIEFGKKNRASFSNIARLTCLICNKIFERGNYRSTLLIFAYKDHYKRHEAQARSCDCNQELKSLTAKQFHFSTVHDGLHGCIKCKKLYKTEEQLNKHMKAHERVFSCSQCDFKISAENRSSAQAKYSIKIHEQTHQVKEQQQQQYVCKICEEDGLEKHFGKACKLKIHIDRVHSARSCPLCGVTVKKLDLHMANIHRSDDEKRYKCNYCGKGFNEKHSLESHAWSQHSGILLKCRYPDCERAYKDASNRTAHEKKSHGRVLGGHYDERMGLKKQLL